jgi:hypothetical protein
MGGVVCLRWVGTGLSETQEKTIEPLITLIRMISLRVGAGGMGMLDFIGENWAGRNHRELAAKNSIVKQTNTT